MSSAMKNAVKISDGHDDAFVDEPSAAVLAVGLNDRSTASSMTLTCEAIIIRAIRLLCSCLLMLSYELTLYTLNDGLTLE